MKQAFHRLSVRTRGKGLTMITAPILDWVSESGIADGLLTLWCRHTSASLIVQENADPTVQQDINSYFEDLVPESRAYRHDYEGADDMPAHIRSVLTNVQLTIPVMGGRPVLGTWQGIYLFEHRRASHGREIVLHLLGD
ncbi:secondary thiamine-phosphate synthase enzyme YjbQ [Asaia bogorensis]|uniref:secondary thiamine-phosphate synthase enzyme YjbQ n=1 Tax=Asaia bogorensis TaxID=91915 RepID=UPI000EFBEE4D|nr:secondary thiamine-phosphate synthase enzyme YjbQ [Asaia bogorensis]